MSEVQELTLVEGHRYRLRNGATTGPLMRDESLWGYAWTAEYKHHRHGTKRWMCWTEDGHWFRVGGEASFDIVGEIE